MPRQYFALQSSEPAYAAAIAALAPNSYTPVGVLRDAAHDPNRKLVATNVTDADLTGDLALLHPAAYPNALCRPRFPDLHAFRRAGFHMLGESERSYENVGGRPSRHVRPRQSVDAGALDITATATARPIKTPSTGRRTRRSSTAA